MLGSHGLGTAGLGSNEERVGNVTLSVVAGAYATTGLSLGLGRIITAESDPTSFTVTGRAVNMYLIGASPPAFDISDGGWTDQNGGSDLYAAVNEVTADDNDFIQSPTLDIGQSATCEMGIEDMTDPQSNFGHRIRGRFRKVDVSGNRAIDLTIMLKEGSTTIASWTYPNVSTSYVDVDEELTPEQCDAITDYGDLSFVVHAEGVA